MFQLRKIYFKTIKRESNALKGLYLEYQNRYNHNK